MSSLGQKLKSLRTSHKLSQTDISKLLGITRSQYCCYEIDRVRPKSTEIAVLSKFYNIDESYFQSNNETEEKNKSISEFMNVLITKRKLLIEEEKVRDLSQEEQELIILYRILSSHDRQEFSNDLFWRAIECLEDDTDLYFK